jgi:hypothetical protein
LRENKAQVAQKIVGRQIFMSRNTKNENLATSLPPKNSSIETSSLLDFVGKQSFTSHDGPNKRMKTFALALKTFSDDPQEMISTNK